MKTADQKRLQLKALEPILPQGIPKDSIISLMGKPGVGKTILSSQLMFELSKAMTPVWYSTFSEPQSRLLSHLEGFDFFDSAKIGANIQFIDLASTFETGETFESVLQRIETETDRLNAQVVFIDGIEQMMEWLKVSKFGFQTLSHLPLYFANHGITTFLLGGQAETESLLFNLVDGIIKLDFEQEEYERKRYIEVLKMRGAPFVAGHHPVRIDKRGYNIFAQQLPVHITESTAERVGAGISGVDKMLNGGFLKNSVVVVQGPSGTGKSIFGIHFLAVGLDNKENAVYYSLEEERPQILRNAVALGFDFAASEKDGTLTIAVPGHDDASIEETLAEIQQLVRAKKPNRLFLDSLTTLRHRQSGERYEKFVLALYSFLKQNGVTAVYASQSDELFGVTSASGIQLSAAMDTIIMLKFVEIEAQIHRAMSVIKARGTDHDKELRELTITDKGMVVGNRFSGVEGVITGAARKVRLEEEISRMGTELTGLAEKTKRDQGS